MRNQVVAAVLVGAVLVGCGRVSESRFNPFNWFGGDQETVVVTQDTGAEARDDLLIATVSELKVDPTPGGAIISTIGVAQTQGFWEAELVPMPTDDADALAFEFRVKPPVTPAPVGAVPSREVLAGTFLSSQSLGNARSITIIATENRRSVSRR